MPATTRTGGLIPVPIIPVPSVSVADHYRIPAVNTVQTIESAWPATVAFAASGEQWRIDYDRTRAQSVRATETRPAIVRLRGPVDRRGEVHAALRRWLRRRARHHLVARLEDLSARHGLPYRRATIRFQRTRWGSCSSRGTISLNARLMFLPPDLVRCVLLHELCHTVHLDHGPRFRALLESLEPDHRVLHRALRHGSRHIPAWALAAQTL